MNFINGIIRDVKLVFWWCVFIFKNKMLVGRDISTIMKFMDDNIDWNPKEGINGLKLI